MADFLEHEAEVSSGSDSENEHGQEKHVKKRAMIDSDDEEEGKLNLQSFVLCLLDLFSDVSL